MQTTLPVGTRTIELDYQPATQVIVFSHGFGVRRDSRGLFTDILAGLPADWGYVLFDYDVIDQAATRQTVTGFADRLQVLQTVFAWARQQPGVLQVHIIGHSMGALTVAELAPAEIGQLVLLAPPLSLGSRFQEFFTDRPGATHQGNLWHIPRTDGTITIVSDEQGTELAAINGEGVLEKLGLFRPYTIVLPETDQILPDTDYTQLITLPSINVEYVANADHDFSGAVRSEAVQLTVQLVTQASAAATPEER